MDAKHTPTPGPWVDQDGTIWTCLLQWRKEQRMAFAAKDARIAELEEALRPFARAAHLNPTEDDKDSPNVRSLSDITVGHIRRAYTVLYHRGDQPKENMR